MPGADGMSAKFMKNAFVGWTFTAGQYYPPDFDPTKLLPLKHLKARGENKEKLMNIRMMFPFTMICDACGEYNYTGTKFTSRVETIKTESYLGLKVYRFYGRCKHCWSEFTFKTDPKNSDYTMESGGKRTYEAWKDADMTESEMKKAKDDAEKDQMKALEQKSIDVQAEMQRIEDLDAIRSLNKRGGHRDQSIEEALEFLFKKQEKDTAQELELQDPEEQDEMAGFKEAQELRKRKLLDDEVEMGTAGASASSGSAAGAGSEGAAGAGGASGSSSGVLAAFGGSKPSDSSGIAAREAAIAAAVAQRTGSQAAKPKFTVKRKAPESATDTSEKDDAKRPCTASASASGTGTADKPATTGGMGGLGLGDYASDSS